MGGAEEFARAVVRATRNAQRGQQANLTGVIKSGTFLAPNMSVDVQLANAVSALPIPRNAWGSAFRTEIDNLIATTPRGSGISGLLTGRRVLLALPSGQPIIICTIGDA
ncbi:hypothetical protein [Nakamurella flava]|uniref:hypothetical protein n=1 Tax=Nakamurella flava TaxID=2576308 RepID=UPI00140BDD5D|nr:hypothetical protein [Nakamurella flava]